jgi:YD repeat-containing protein
MVGIVSSNRLGLFNASLDILGLSAGQSGLGQAKGAAQVNIATGNLSVQFLDESLSGTGADFFALRSYNSQGALTDGDADGWRWDGEKRIRLNDTAGSSRSSVVRTLGDGSETTYVWNGSRYASTAGSGAHDSISWDAAGSQFIFRQDSSNTAVEMYNASTGWIKSSRDSSGNGFNYVFTGDKLSSITDIQSGQTFVFNYGANNKLERIDTASQLGGSLTRQVYYGYDALNRLASVKTDLTPNDNSIADGLVYTTNYSYDGTSTRIASISQSDGTSVNFTYYTDGRVASVTDQSGTTSFVYNADSTNVTNGNGEIWVYSYDVQKQLTKYQSPAVNGVVQSVTYNYDTAGNVINVTDGRGNAVTYSYDLNGNREKEVDVLGNTVTRTFNTNNQLLSETRYTIASLTAPGGAETQRFVYDNAGRLIFSISAEGRVSQTLYNSNGSAFKSIQYAGGFYTGAGSSEANLINWLSSQDKTKTQLSEFTYDYRGNLNKKIDYAKVDVSGSGILNSDANVTEYVYSEYGQLLQTIAVRGVNRDVKTSLSSVVYDGLGRQISAFNESGSTTSSYNGTLTTVSNIASGLSVVSTTDNRGRLTSLSTSGNGTTRAANYVYDNAGRLRITQDATGARSYLFYDAAGRVSANVSATGAVTAFTFDADGRVLTETLYATAIAATTLNTWTSALTTPPIPTFVADAINDRKTIYTYDQAGRLSTTKASSLEAVTNVYDGRSRVIKTLNGLSIATQYFYDKDGLQLGTLNAENYLSENIYDSVGRVIKTVHYGKRVTAASNNFAAMKADVATDVTLSTYYYYDSEGRQVGSVSDTGALTEVVYDAAANQRKTIQYLTGVIARDSDTLDSLRANAGVGETFTTQYDGYGRVDYAVSVDGTKTRNIYDAASRLVRQIYADGTTEQRETRTQYNAFGEVTGVVGGVGSATIRTETDAAITTAITNFGTRYKIDGVGRQVTKLGASGQKTFLFYNTAGQLTYAVNALGEVSKTSYNTFGQVSETRAYTKRLLAADLAQITAGGIDTFITAAANRIGDDATDSVTATFYNQFGAVNKVIDAEKYVSTLDYTTYGSVYLQTTNYDGGSTQTLYSYDNLQRQIGVRQNTGKVWAGNSTTYDAFNRVIKSTDAKGNATTIDYSSYNANSFVTTTNALSKEISNSRYDHLNRIISSDAGNGTSTTYYSYNNLDRSVTTSTSAQGSNNVITNTTWKNRFGEVEKEQDARGGNVTYTYDRDGQVLTVTDAKSIRILENYYDRSGHLYYSYGATVNNASGGERSFSTVSYDLAGRRSFENVGGTASTYSYDGQGRKIESTEAASVKTTYEYDRTSHVKQIVTDPAGLQLKTSFTYDGRGNILTIRKGTVTEPDQNKTMFIYDKLGRKTQEIVDSGIGKLNLTTEYKYDLVGNVTRTIDAKGNSTWFVYNAANQKTHEINQQGAVTVFKYMNSGALHHVYQYATAISTATFGDAVTSITLPTATADDRQTYSVYDSLGRLRYTLNAKNAIEWTVSENVYDNNGNVISLITYDKTLSQTQINLMIPRFNGFMDSHVSIQLATLGYTATQTGNARVTRYEYDANDRQIKTTLPGWYSATEGKVTLTAEFSDSFQRTIEVTYDGAGNAVANKIRTGVNDFVYQYKTYDTAGRVVYDVDGLGYVTKNTYNALGNLKTVTRFGDVGSSIGAPTGDSWNPSEITTKLAGKIGRTVTYNYDAAGRKTSVVQPSVSLGETGMLQSPETFYVYDALGHVTKQSIYISQGHGKLPSTNSNTYYFYDSIGRQYLTVDAENYGTKTEYDALGNVTRVTEYANKGTDSLNSTTTPPTFTSSSKDRITEYTYDSLGHVLTTKRALFDDISTLVKVDDKTYNLFGEVRESRDALSNLTTLEYDRLGEIIKTTEPSRITASRETDVFKDQVTATPTTEFVYDAFGQTLSQSRKKVDVATGEPITITHEYDLVGNQIKTTDALSNAVRTKYDANGRIIAEIQAVKVVTDSLDTRVDYSYNTERRYEYDKAGHQTAVLDVFNNGSEKSGTVQRFNGYGEVESESKVWGAASTATSSLSASASSSVAIARYEYNNNGQVIYKQASDGHTFFYYDLAGRLLSQKQSETASEPSAQLTTRETRYTYDLLGRVVSQQLPGFTSTQTGQLGNTSKTYKTPITNNTLDRWGNVLTHSDAIGTVTNYGYDQDNRAISVIGPALNTIDYSGNTFQTQVETINTYDVLGRLTSEKKIIAGDNLGGHETKNQYNAVGQLIKTIDATDVAMEFTYDIHGNKVGTRNALGETTIDRYDLNNQLVDHAILRRKTMTNPFNNDVTETILTKTLTSYQYDQAGRKYAEGDAAFNYQYYKYDERNNVVAARNRGRDEIGLGVRTFTYDVLGHKTEERMSGIANELLNSWSYSSAQGTDFIDFKSDLALKHNNFDLTYDEFGQLKTETLSATLTYSYLENGLLASISEITVSNSSDPKTTAITNTQYAYDIKGNRTAEIISSSVDTAADRKLVYHYDGPNTTVTWVDYPAYNNSTGNLATYYQYDDADRLIKLNSPSTSITTGTSGIYATTNVSNLQYDYDAWGNRLSISASYTLPSATEVAKTKWYGYDNANRVVIEGGVVTEGTLDLGYDTDAIGYSYDGVGRRVQEMRFLDHRAPINPYYNFNETTTDTYKVNNFYYNDLGLVLQVDLRVDMYRENTRARSGFLQSVEKSTLEVNRYDDRGYKLESAGKDTNTFEYNVDGTLKFQTTRSNATNTVTAELTDYVYDNLGNLKSYSYTAYQNNGSFTNYYTNGYRNTFSGIQLSSTTVTSRQQGTAAGQTINSYDDRGRLIHSNIGAISRDFAYNAQNQIIVKWEKDKAQNYYYNSGGGELANFGSFGVNISPLTPAYSGGSTPSSYTINSGDTLVGIAQSLFGDGKLWYLIADANGLTQGPTEAFKISDVGRNLRIPNSDKVIGNTASNFKPYSAGDKIGNLTPDLNIAPPPLPPPGMSKACLIISTIIVVVIAAVVTAGTATLLAPSIGTLLGVSATSTLAVGTSFLVGGAAGSLLSQVAGNFLHIQKGIDFKQVATSGLISGFTAGVGRALKGIDALTNISAAVDNADKTLNFLGRFTQGAASYLGSYGANKLLCIETTFNWKDLAVSSLASGASGGYWNKAGSSDNGALRILGNTAKNFINSTAKTGLNAAFDTGQKPDWALMAADAFGNALGTEAVRAIEAKIAKNAAAKKVEVESVDLTGIAQGVNNGEALNINDLGGPSIEEIQAALTKEEPKRATSGPLKSTGKKHSPAKNTGGNKSAKKLEEINTSGDAFAISSYDQESSDIGNTFKINERDYRGDKHEAIYKKDKNGVSRTRNEDNGRFVKSPIKNPQKMNSLEKENWEIVLAHEEWDGTLGKGQGDLFKATLVNIKGKNGALEIGVKDFNKILGKSEIVINKDGFVGKLEGSAEAGLMYAQGNYDGGKLGKVEGSVRSSAEIYGSVEAQVKLNKFGVPEKIEAGFSGGAQAVALMAEGKYENSIKILGFTVKTNVTAEGHLGGIGASYGGGVKMNQAKGTYKFYGSGGLTPGVGGKVKAGLEIQLPTRATEFINKATEAAKPFIDKLKNFF